MKRDPDAEDLRLWAVVSATVRPLKPAQHASRLPTASSTLETKSAKRPKLSTPAHVPHRPAPSPTVARGPLPPADIDANLRHRLARGRESLVARIDLHGLTQDAARAALTGFIRRAADDGWRAVLVITGRGVAGDGVLRRRVPDWLGEPPIRPHVAGISEAHRRHGGEGALYVALKRRR
jgi:DNA-nicking Smr family endonuclease